MSKTLRLQPRDGSCTFRKITQGRRWVGRVTQHADGDYVGVIGPLMARGATEEAAFREVAARQFGFASAEALRQRNREVSRANREKRAASRANVDAFLRSLRLHALNKDAP